MNDAVTVNCKFHLKKTGQRTKVREGEAKPSHKAFSKAVPRISRLMALAIRFDGLIRESAVTNLSELAALGHVTRARVTQIMNLLNLAPDIQEDLLYLEKPGSGRETITERSVRTVALEPAWQTQRRIWKRLSGREVR